MKNTSGKNALGKVGKMTVSLATSTAGVVASGALRIR
jgi:hypothetical protein